jgi:integral membrane sensor domain MASE1
MFKLSVINNTLFTHITVFVQFVEFNFLEQIELVRHRKSKSNFNEEEHIYILLLSLKLLSKEIRNLIIYYIIPPLVLTSKVHLVIFPSFFFICSHYSQYPVRYDIHVF